MAIQSAKFGRSFDGQLSTTMTVRRKSVQWYTEDQLMGLDLIGEKLASFASVCEASRPLMALRLPNGDRQTARFSLPGFCLPYNG